MESVVFSKATPEKRFTTIFIATEIAVTIVVGSAVFAGLANILM
jgi:hypothetical protein